MIGHKVATGRNPRRSDDLEAALTNVLSERIVRVICLDDKCTDEPSCHNKPSCIEYYRREGFLRSSDQSSLFQQLRYDHIWVKDFTAPTSGQMERFCRALDKSIEDNVKTLVHCGAGIGRTGIMLCAYHIWKGRSAVEAIQKVRTSGKRIGRAFERDVGQREALNEFERFVRITAYMVKKHPPRIL